MFQIHVWMETWTTYRPFHKTYSLVIVFCQQPYVLLNRSHFHSNNLEVLHIHTNKHKRTHKALITFCEGISHPVLCRQFSCGRRGIYQAVVCRYVNVHLWCSFTEPYLACILIVSAFPHINTHTLTDTHSHACKLHMQACTHTHTHIYLHTVQTAQ